MFDVTSFHVQFLLSLKMEVGLDCDFSCDLVPGAISEESGRHTLPVPTDVDVHVRVRVLLAEEQPVGDIRRQSARPRVCH